MVKTGYISFITESGGGIVNGDVTGPTIVNSEYFKCNIDTNSKQYITTADGQQQQAEFSVIVEESFVKDVDIKSKSNIQLRDNNGNDLGTKQIQNVEYLNLTKKVKIVV